MSITINFNIPNEEIPEGRAALEKRMAVLGYTFGAAAVPVIDGTAGYAREKSEQEFRENLDAVGERIAEVKAEAEEPKKRGRKAKAEPEIRANPENRVEPEADDEATAAQDAADEAAEVEASREPEKPLTIDDVKNAMGDYVKKFGMEAIQADGPGIFISVLGNPPTGETTWKLSLLKDAKQEVLAALIARWKQVSAADARFGGA